MTEADVLRAYQTLEIRPEDSTESVKAAYRVLVKVWHPDRFSADPKLQLKAQEKLKEINLAYECLTIYRTSRLRGNLDPHSREGGDKNRKQAPKQPRQGKANDARKTPAVMLAAGNFNLVVAGIEYVPDRFATNLEYRISLRTTADAIAINGEIIKAGFAVCDVVPDDCPRLRPELMSEFEARLAARRRQEQFSLATVGRRQKIMVPFDKYVGKVVCAQIIIATDASERTSNRVEKYFCEIATRRRAASVLQKIFGCQ